MLWQPGDVVVWRSVTQGRRYCSIPVRVVEDEERCSVLYLSEGTEFVFTPGAWPFGDHPWEARGAWSGHGVLILARPGAAHTIWHFWQGDARDFAGWYVNMQEPLRRDGSNFDTEDQELDIWIRPDGSWTWKDEEELREWVERGRFTAEQAAEIRAEGERVLAEWPFPTGWEEWTPDPGWDVPTLRGDEVTDA